MTGQEQHGAPHTSRHMISIKIFRKRITRLGLSMGQKKDPGSNTTSRAFEDNGTPKYRGVAHPLCFTDEMKHVLHPSRIQHNGDTGADVQ